MRQSTTPALIVLSLVTVGLIITLAYASDRPKRNGAPVLADDPREVRQEVLAAFRDPKTKVEVPVGVKELFEQAGADLRAGGHRFGTFFNAERLVQEMNRDGLLDRAGLNAREHRDFATGLTRGLPKIADQIIWDHTEFRAIRWLLPREEAVLITSHTTVVDGEKIKFRMRWWVKRSLAGWRFYDFEDLSTGGRVSTFVSMMAGPALAQGMVGVGKVKQFGDRFKEAKDALFSKDFKRAEELLQIQVPVILPDKVVAMIDVWRSLAQVSQFKAAEALVSIERAERIDRDMPIVDYVKTLAYAHLQKPEQTLVHAKRFMDQLGPDDIILVLQASAYENLHRPAEARDAYLLALDEQPDSLDALSGLLRTLEADRKNEFVKRFVLLSKPDENFSRFVSEALSADDLAAAEALIDEVQRRNPRSVETRFQRGRLSLRAERFDDAKRHFLEAITESTAEVRDRYLRTYLDEMLEKKKEIEAYRSVALSDACRAFRILAEDLLDSLEDRGDRIDTKPLADLIAAHRKRKPDDVWLYYFTAQVHMSNEQCEEAEKLLAEGMSKKLESEDRNRFRALRVLAFYRMGQGLAAYQKLGTEAFEQLANNYFYDNNAPGLDALIKLHRQAVPRDVALHCWQAKAHWLAQEYADAAKFMQRYVNERKADDKRWDWQAVDILVRSLVRLKRFDGARKILNDHREQLQLSLLRAALEAAAGNVRKTEEILDELVKKDHFSSESFYFDADLGPALRTEPFTRLREKFPPPKDNRPLRKT